MLARARGYRCRIVMPDDQAVEKQQLLRALGAELQLVRPVAIASPDHYVRVARRAAEALRAGGASAVFCDQFETPSNARCHYETTGAEIWAQCRGVVHAFVAGAGTGGTLAGVARRLLDEHAHAGRASRAPSGACGGGGWLAWLHWLLPALAPAPAPQPAPRAFLVDPPGSALFAAVEHGVAFAPQQADAARAPRRHRYDTIVEGVGCDRVTGVFAAALALPLAGAFRCADAEAVAMSRWLARAEGLHLGPSAALNAVGAVKAARALGPGHTVVTVLCDGGGRHASRLWNDEFLRGRPGLAEAAAEGCRAAEAATAAGGGSSGSGGVVACGDGGLLSFVRD